MAEAERGVLIADAAPFAGPGGSTTHFSVVDKWGNVVSYTNTIESSHGAGMFAGYTLPDGSFRSFGFLLNNELTDFNFTPAFNPPNNPGANDVAPGKRPRSSMVPTMIFTPSGEPLVALGSPGGSTIINSVFNTVLNLIDHRMDLQDAINAPRVSATTSPAGTISCEGTQPYMLPKISVATQDALRAVGHAGLGTVPGVDACTAAEIGSVQAVIVDLQTGKQYGGADPRREGTVIGLPRPQGR
jgi:gamma-glutamyltranspeptidase/glutathione hydrolase